MARVLVVDDDESVRVLLRMALEKAGHSVCEAGDGAAALKALQSQPCDVAIVDLVMPVKSGLETLMELRSRHSGLGVVLVTATVKTGSETFANFQEKFGVRYVFSKPLDTDRVVAAVADLAAHKSGA